MTGSPIKSQILSMRCISRLSHDLARQLGLPPGHHSIGLFTADCDDVAYTALDEATKRAQVQVVYARSCYAGAANASTRLAGEVIGVLSGPTPEEVCSSLDAVRDVFEHQAFFQSANADGSVSYYAHCISRSGSYLSQAADVPTGSPLAYLIAPPLEALFGLDAALKAANVRIARFYGPPSETNFGGGLLTGSQSDCAAACRAFARAVVQVAAAPQEYRGKGMIP